MSHLTPEFRLVAACAMWPPSPARSQAVEALAPIVDWTAFDQLVHRHRIDGLVVDALRRAGLTPPQAIQSRASRIAMVSLTLAAETARLQAAFDEAKVKVAFLKGALLAQEAYGDIGIRHSKDIDLLVDGGQLESAWAVMEGLGYERATPPKDLTPAQLRLFLKWSKDGVLNHPGRNIEVELHWRLSDGADTTGAPPSSSWRAVSIGQNIPIFTFNETDRFLYLCAHGTGHAWMRLKWLADIGALLAAGPDAPDRYWRAAQDAGAEIPVEVSLRLSAMLFGAALPKSLPAEPGFRVRTLTNLSMRTLTVGPQTLDLHDTFLGHVAEPLAGLLLTKGFGSQVSLVLKNMISVEDLLLLRLPGPLQFLYPVLRLPVWVVKTLSGHGRRSQT